METEKRASGRINPKRIQVSKKKKNKNKNNNFHDAKLRTRSKNMEVKKNDEDKINDMKDNTYDPINKEKFIIYLGKGKGVDKMQANKLYRNILNARKEEYHDKSRTRRNEVKRQIAREIIAACKRKGAIFCHKPDNDEELPYDIVLTKVQQALREKHHLLTPSSSLAHEQREQEDSLEREEDTLLISTISKKNSGDDYNDHDHPIVYLGKGKQVVINNEGNKLFTNLINLKKYEYQSASSRESRHKVVLGIIESLKTLGVTFFFRKHRCNDWQEAPHQTIVEKVIVALRERGGVELKRC